MDQAFINAIRAQKARIVCFGVALRPLTVGHLFVLHEISSALPDHADQAEFDDVITAVMVCAQRTHAGARGMLASRFAGLGFWAWGYVTRKKSREKEVAVFADYLREQLGTPQMDEMGGRGGMELRVPLCWRLLAMLMADFHVGYQEALDVPVALAMTLWTVQADRSGASKLASERQIVFREWAAEMEKERLAKEEEEEPQPAVAPNEDQEEHQEGNAS